MSTTTRAGLSDWQWVGVAASVILIGLFALQLTGGLDDIRAGEAVRAQRAASAEAESTERAAVQDKARQLATADAVELANKGIRPTRSEVRKLAMERAKSAGMVLNENTGTAWQIEYEAVFKRAYKAELEW